MSELRGVVYMIKRRGARTETCGTPQKQVWREEKLLSHFTREGREDIRFEPVKDSACQLFQTTRKNETIRFYGQ